MNLQLLMSPVIVYVKSKAFQKLVLNVKKFHENVSNLSSIFLSFVFPLQLQEFSLTLFWQIFRENTVTKEFAKVDLTKFFSSERISCFSTDAFQFWTNHFHAKN